MIITRLVIHTRDTLFSFEAEIDGNIYSSDVYGDIIYKEGPTLKNVTEAINLFLTQCQTKNQTTVHGSFRP